MYSEFTVSYMYNHLRVMKLPYSALSENLRKNSVILCCPCNVYTSVNNLLYGSYSISSI